MATIHRLVVTWNGIAGMPGYTNFYFNSTGTPDVSVVTAFFDALKSSVPTGLSWTVPSSGDSFNDATGALLGGWSGSGGGTVTSTAVDVDWAGGTGAVINWLTDTVVGNRRLRGRTFIVPIITANYDNGSLTSSFQTGLQDAALEFLDNSDPEPVVWHRPVGGSGGVSADITDAQVPDLAAVLRSRRD